MRGTAQPIKLHEVCNISLVGKVRKRHRYTYMCNYETGLQIRIHDGVKKSLMQGWIQRYGYYASSVIIAKNSCSLISPSWSRSNSSIIALLSR
jgi:hypothetical protein